MFNKKTKLAQIIFSVMIIASILVFSLAVVDFRNKKFNRDQMQIFSWWTGGGEAKALDELFELYQKQHPNTEVINAAVSGGGGVKAKAVLKSRVLGGNPPNSFQVHAGSELIENYVKTDLMHPVTNILEKQEIKDKFNQQLLEWCSYQGEIYSVPVNVHRGNVLWYNKRVLRKYGIQPPTNLNEFLAALQKLEKETEVTPLALGDKNKWPATHLFETVLLSVLGAEDYNELWNDRVRLARHRAHWQETTDFKDEEVKHAIKTFGQILKYTNSNHASLTWQEAADLVVDRQAAFYVMGDWTAGYFKKRNLRLEYDFDWMPFPGSTNSFMTISDTFGFPKDTANPEATKDWLKLIASKKGQDEFNPVKGSIPSRLDANKKEYDRYSTAAIDDFSKQKLTPSAVHGSAARPSFVVELNDIMNQFVTERNVQATHDRLKKIEREYLGE